MLFEKLKILKSATGTLAVAKTMDPSLHKWVTRQRAQLVSGCLSDDRKAKLESLGIQTTTSNDPSTHQHMVIPGDTEVIN